MLIGPSQLTALARVSQESGGAEADSKRLKPTPPDPAVVRKQAMTALKCLFDVLFRVVPVTRGSCCHTTQVEYYLSDENLKYDKFFHDKISGNADGWLDAR